MIVLIILLIALCGFLYRMGGAKGYDTKYRDIGCSLCILAIAYLIGIRNIWWTWLLAFGLHWGGLSTYHKWMNKLFGDSKDDVHWYGWFMHGFVIGLAIIPITYHSVGISLLRAGIAGILVTCWSEFQDNVVWEEVGRGVIISSTVLLFCL